MNSTKFTLLLRRSLAVFGLGVLLLLPLAACEKDGPIENAGEEVDEALGNDSGTFEEAGEAVDEALDDAGDAIEDAGDEVEDALDDDGGGDGGEV